MPEMKKAVKNTFTFINNETNETFEFPVYEGSIGPDVVDISKFYQKTGCFTYDPGFTSTASCESKITYIDGEKGVLLYRGYPIEQLAKHSNFIDTCWLLLHGELPSKEERDSFEYEIKYHTMLNEQLSSMVRGFRRTSHPMAIMTGVCGALSAFYHDRMDIFDPTYRHQATCRLIAKMPTIAAMAYKYSLGQPFIYPDNTLSYAENFLHMMFATPCEKYHVNPLLAKTMDIILLLHADHEQNASTSTVRLAGSSHANPFACVAAGVAALWGPAHGGANEAVLNMLTEIGSVDHIHTYIKRAKDPQDPFRLMGFGHRVYKNYDPRARIMRQMCHDVLEELGKKNEPKLKLAIELEKIALEDSYFVERKLYPNVDFYSGIIFEAMNIPLSMFTVFFAVARSIGWIAQWNEMIEDPLQKIGRPRQLFTGSKQRDL